VVWRVERVQACWYETSCFENPVITFLIMKRIYTETFIDRTAALSIVENRIRVVTDEGNQQVAVFKKKYWE